MSSSVVPHYVKTSDWPLDDPQQKYLTWNTVPDNKNINADSMLSLELVEFQSSMKVSLYCNSILGSIYII